VTSSGSTLMDGIWEPFLWLAACVAIVAAGLWL
jgi:hypothetical protein